MKKKPVIFAAAAAVIIVGAAVIFTLPKQDKPKNSDVPEFIMPESTQQDTTQQESSAAVTESTANAPSQTVSTTSQDAALPVTEPESVPEDTQPPEPEQTSAATTATSPIQTSVSQSTAQTEPVTEPHEVTEEPQPEPLEDNVLITSGDPLHYTRFEFTQRRVRFSGVYSSDSVIDVMIYKPNISSSDLFTVGDSFRGSLDVTSLSPGYYVIIIRLQSGAGMYYVFEMTADGSRAVPEDKLPAAENLAASEHPLELQKEGVEQHITLRDGGNSRDILAQVKSLSDRICTGLSDDYDKARALAQWVSVNMYYDKDASEKGFDDELLTLDFVLQNHRSVCFGWSNLYAALCQAQGIDCYNASGTVVTGSRCFDQTTKADERAHAWNMVIIDGRKIWVDTVWCSSNIYETECYIAGATDMQYFDIDNSVLSLDHRVTRFEHRDYYG